MSRDHMKHEKDIQLSSLAARSGLFSNISSLPGAGIMNDYSTILSAAMMNAAASNSLNSLPPPVSLFNNPTSSIAAAVANLNSGFTNAAVAANQSIASMQPTQNSPSTTPLNASNQQSNTTNTPPTNLNSFTLNSLDQAANYIQHASPYIQW